MKSGFMGHKLFMVFSKMTMWRGQLFEIPLAILNALNILGVLSALSGISELNSLSGKENLLHIPS